MPIKYYDQILTLTVVVFWQQASIVEHASASGRHSIPMGSVGSVIAMGRRLRIGAIAGSPACRAHLISTSIYFLGQRCLPA